MLDKLSAVSQDMVMYGSIFFCKKYCFSISIYLKTDFSLHCKQIWTSIYQPNENVWIFVKEKFPNDYVSEGDSLPYIGTAFKIIWHYKQIHLN